MNRIYFTDNPWPNGHRIVNFEWGAHFKLDEEAEKQAGLYFDLHLETADYDEEDTGEDEEEQDDEETDDWHAKIVWNNYHSCTLSSEEWDEKGFLVGSEQSPFDPEDLDGKTFTVDDLSDEELEHLDLDTTAFDVYLLGHDASAFHTIQFTRAQDAAFDIHWKGKLALVYAGDENFRYDFHAFISSVNFRGISVPDELTDQEAYELLKRFVKKPELSELQAGQEQRRFVLKFAS